VRRPIGCWLLLLPLLLLAGACTPTVVLLRAPVLDREGVDALLVAAEVARADAFTNADPRPLRAAFADSATAAILPELARLRQRGERIEERASTRRLVHWAAAAGTGEGVLEVAGEQRIGLAGEPPRAWSRIVRQWWAARHWTRGRWLVLRSADLPPDQWWKA
jgi:3-oxoacyl-[acyl-carrier-protein] synthase III